MGKAKRWKPQHQKRKNNTTQQHQQTTSNSVGDHVSRQNTLSAEMIASLETLEPGSTVAILTLLGSLCPVTLSHVAALTEGRRFLLSGSNNNNNKTQQHQQEQNGRKDDSESGGDKANLQNKTEPEDNTKESQRPTQQEDEMLLPNRPAGLEEFDFVLGFFSLNGDHYLERKFYRMGIAPPLDLDERTELVRLAISDYRDWMGIEEWEGATFQYLQYKYPQLNFVHFSVNGADDVIKYRKWNFANEYQRFLAVGRPGLTEELKKQVSKSSRADPAHFVIGPELEDISSTEARDALERRELGELDRLLCPLVARWCLEQDPLKWKMTV